MHIPLLQPPRPHGPRQVRVAVEVELTAREGRVDVGVAPGAEQVVDAAAVGVDAVPGERVVDDGAEGAEVGEGGPEAGVEAEVGRVQLLGAGGPEALAGVVEVPDVEVACWTELVTGAFCVHQKGFHIDDWRGGGGGEEASYQLVVLLGC